MNRPIDFDDLHVAAQGLCPEFSTSLDDQTLAAGLWLVSPPPPPEEFIELLAALPPEALQFGSSAVLLTSSFPGWAMAEVLHKWRQDDPVRFVQACSPHNVPYRLMDRMVAQIMRSENGAVVDAMHCVRALRILLDAGVPSWTGGQDRWGSGGPLSCLLHRWWNPDPSQTQDPFDNPGSVGVLAAAVNLMMAYGIFPEDISDPTGHLSDTHYQLRMDVEFGPLMEWRPGVFLKSLLEAGTAAACAYYPRPRL